MNVPLVDLRIEQEERAELDAAIGRVLDSGFFLLGPELDAFEAEMSAQLGGSDVVGVGSGTDALTLGMKACGIGPGDEVLVPALTAFPTAAAVISAGAEPVLVDVGRDVPLIDLASVERMIGPRTKAVIAVHLYGLTADIGHLDSLLSGTGVSLIEDCAQAQGAVLDSGRPAGTVGRFGAFSFYPTKVLGSLADGGAVATTDEALGAEVRAWRAHGERSQRYLHELPAGNSRLSEIQAAVLRVRLARFPERLQRLRAISTRYARELPDHLGYLGHGHAGAPHLSVVRVDDPDATSTNLSTLGVGTGRHYPRALVDQPALAGIRSDDVPNARRWAATVLSIPLFQGLRTDQQDHVLHSVEAVG